MSAPSLVHGHTLLPREPPLPGTPPARGTPTPPRPVPAPVGRPARDRRSADPVARLTREFDALCTQAVDAWEVAAGLEAGGWNDDRVRTALGYPDVFTLAAEMFARTPRRVDRTREHNPWEERPRHHLLHGLTFALPGLLYSSAGVAVPPGPQIWLLVGGLVVGWSASQALGYAAQVALGWGRGPAARSMIRTATLAALAGALLAGGLLLALTPAAAPVVVLALAVPVYMVAAGFLLVLRRDVELTAALALGGGGAAAAGLLDQRAVAGLLALATLGAVVLRVLSLTLTAPWRPREPGIPGQLTATGLQAGWGVVSAATLLVTAEVVDPRAVVPGLIALAFWMGPAEWVIHRLRRVGWDLLQDGRRVAVFRDAVGLGLLTWFGLWTAGFALCGAALVLLLAGPDALAGGAPLVLVGAGLVCGLTTVALGRISAATAVSLAALAPAGAAVALGHAVVAVPAFAALAAGQLLLALRTATRPAAHL